MKYFFLLALLFLSSCATLYSVGPVATVESPEIPHDEPGHWDFVIKNEPTEQYIIAKDVSERPLKVERPPQMNASSAIVPGINVNVSNRFQFGFALDGTGIFLNYWG